MAKKTTYSAQTICVLNQKGGVGKTTTVTNLAAGFTRLGKKVLMIDLDPQSNLTSIMKCEVNEGMYEFFLGGYIKKEEISELLHLLPCTLTFSGIELQIINKFNREHILNKLIEKEKSNYDYIIIDCPPALSFITINALVTANMLLIPLSPSKFSYNGLESLLSFSNEIKSQINPNLNYVKILITNFDERRKVSKQTVEKLADSSIAEDVLKTYIHKSEKFLQAEEADQDIFTNAPSSIGAADYGDLCKEIIKVIK